MTLNSGKILRPRPRTRRLMRRLAPLLAIALAISACSSSSSSGDSSLLHPFHSADSGVGAEPQQTDEQQTYPDPSTATPSLDLAGTLTETVQGATLGLTWRIGDIMPGSPSGAAPSAVPESALQACNVDYTTDIASSVFIPASVDINYERGRLPAILALVNNQLISNMTSLIAFNIDGQWQCNDEDGVPGTSLTLQAGSDMTVEAWIFGQVLSNEQPEVTTSERNSWYFSGGGVGFNGGYNPSESADGPGAVCSSDQNAAAAVFLYLRYTDSDACRQLENY